MVLRFFLFLINSNEKLVLTDLKLAHNMYLKYMLWGGVKYEF